MPTNREQIGTIKNVINTIKATSPSGEVRILSSGDTIFFGDVITVEDGASAQLIINGQPINLAPYSQIEINHHNPNVLQVVEIDPLSLPQESNNNNNTQTNEAPSVAIQALEKQDVQQQQKSIQAEPQVQPTTTAPKNEVAESLFNGELRNDTSIFNLDKTDNIGNTKQLAEEIYEAPKERGHSINAPGFIKAQQTRNENANDNSNKDNNDNNPVNGSPLITGSVKEDKTLSVNTNTIRDDDGLGDFSFQWLRHRVAIVGATNATYTLGDDDVGAQMTVTITYTDGQGTNESVTSAATSAVSNVNDDPVGLPTITGTTTAGETLTANTRGISDADGLGTFSFQWLRDGVSVGDATNETYLLAENDVGGAISVQVSYTDDQGTDENITSAATDPITSDIVTIARNSNKITGTNKNDELIGTDDNDLIYALAGNDTIYGKLGDDTIEGGAGRDRYVYEGILDRNGNPIEGHDLLSGFDKHDKVDISTLLEAVSKTDADVRITDNNGSAKVEVANNEGGHYGTLSITFDGVADTDLQIVNGIITIS